MKWKAPFLSAATAIGTSPWPVMKITGSWQQPRASSSSKHSSPLGALHADVEHDAAAPVAAPVGEKASAEAQVRQTAPRLEQPFEGVADGFVVVDDVRAGGIHSISASTGEVRG